MCPRAHAPVRLVLPRPCQPLEHNGAGWCGAAVGLARTAGHAGIERLFAEAKVDIVFEAHQHTYERLWPTYNGTVLNGTSVAGQPYTDPLAAVHIVTGQSNTDKGAHEEEGGWGREREKGRGREREREREREHARERESAREREREREGVEGTQRHEPWPRQ